MSPLICDGNIRKGNFTITNTKETCEFIGERLEILYGIKAYVHPIKGKNAFRVSVYKKIYLKHLYHLLYDDITHFHLERKIFFYYIIIINDDLISN